MDRSWIRLDDTLLPEYLNGIGGFLKFAYANKQPDSEIRCPCKICKNSLNKSKADVLHHLVLNGFLKTYTNWICHGETPWYLMDDNVENDVNEVNVVDDMYGLVHEGLGSRGQTSGCGGDDQHEQKGPDKDAEIFFNILKDAETEIYPGCKFTLLSFVVRLLHMKSLYCWSNKSCTALLEFFKEVIPPSERFPSSYSEARKIIKELGLDYKKIHACPNDCMLYWNDTVDDVVCRVCQTPRYKQFEGHSDDDDKKEHKIPAKVMRYFPLKPRLQRLFMSSKTASLMRWHDEERTKDGMLRHPADSLAWRTFDEQHPDFAKDNRNVRLGLASDGFNPFKTMSIAHSTWPVVLMPYNLPPWMCLKQPSFMLCLLIDGPRAPGNDIDVYLQPLIDELKDLWDDGLPTYDAASNKMFRMRAALLWTINDFPAYANLSGWSTKGKFACPCCNKETHSLWLKHGKKFCFMAHRRFLDIRHKFRTDRVSFDGTLETREKPARLSGDELLEQLNSVVTEYGKCQSSIGKKRKRGYHSNDNNTRTHNWKKNSIFFQLPYWKQNLNRHNLDIMHVQKNVSDNILYTLLDAIGKSKDNLKARRDLEEMGIRKSLHPQEMGNNKVYLPPACFTMSKDGKDMFCKLLKDVKVPDGYASNISRCVNSKERNVTGLKSHDSHILLEQLLPLAVRRILPKNVSEALIELSSHFRQLYSKVSNPRDVEVLQERIALTLCHLEKIFPPQFFDIMVHLTIHLAEEVLIAGPVQYRSMWSIERYLKTLKDYVRNRSRPEGSIAEGYLAEECVTFCARYLHDVESKLNRPVRNDEGGDDSSQGSGRGLGKSKQFRMDDSTWVQAHRYVLFNSTIVEEFREIHKKKLEDDRPRRLEFERNKIHNDSFHKWFQEHVRSLERKGEADSISNDQKLLASGPVRWARRYSGYIINGFRFHTKDRERRRKTQNSGVLLNASADSFSSTKDKNPISGRVTFHGVLTDIIEIRYSNSLKFVLFKCDWVNNNNIGTKQDEFNFTLVNFNHLMYTHNRDGDEPFILANQAEQVWYVQDLVEQDWHTVMKMTPRDTFDMNDSESLPDAVLDTQVEPFSVQQLDDSIFIRDDEVPWVREGVDGTTIEASTSKGPNETGQDGEDEYATDEDADVDESSYDEDYADSADECFSDENNYKSEDSEGDCENDDD